MSTQLKPLLLGYSPSRGAAPLDFALSLAAELGVTLWVGVVDPTRYTLQRFANGFITSAPVDADAPEHETWPPVDELQQNLSARLNRTGILWEFRLLAGDPAKELAWLAASIDARALVLGTPHRTFLAHVGNMGFGQRFSRPTAVALAQKQLRPVFVIPQASTIK